MTTRTSFLALAILLISAMAAVAGTGYPMKCKNCGFASDVLIGGGRDFEQVTGFCVESGKFVYLQWKRGKEARTDGQVLGFGDWQNDRSLQVPGLPPAVHPASPENRR